MASAGIEMTTDDKGRTTPKPMSMTEEGEAIVPEFVKGSSNYGGGSSALDDQQCEGERLPLMLESFLWPRASRAVFVSVLRWECADTGGEVRRPLTAL